MRRGMRVKAWKPRARIPMNKYPEGKLSPDDEGEVMVMIGVKNNKVIIAFPNKTVSWFGMGKEQAVQIANSILQHAATITAALLFVFVCHAARATECLPSARAVWEAHPGSHATWRGRLPGHEGEKCWFNRGDGNEIERLDRPVRRKRIYVSNSSIPTPRPRPDLEIIDPEAYAAERWEGDRWAFIRMYLWPN